MMSVEQARKFAETHFPEGPEKLATKLGVEVREAPLAGCDGWVLTGPACTLIRINSDNQRSRRRFTLAHELGHLLLGIPTVVGETVIESLRSNDAEERKVNDLASELLLPESRVKQHLSAVPVVASQLRKLAKEAKISEVATAIRVANLAKSIGLVNASVIFFKDEKLEWHWSRTLEISSTEARRLLVKAKEKHPEAARIHRPATNDVVVVSMIDNPGFGSTTVFVQLLPEEVGQRLSNDELRRQLEASLFEDDDEFRRKLQGVFGAFKNTCAGLDLESAVVTFFSKTWLGWSEERVRRIKSQKGRQYVRLRLQEWCS